MMLNSAQVVLKAKPKKWNTEIQNPHITINPSITILLYVLHNIKNALPAYWSIFLKTSSVSLTLENKHILLCSTWNTFFQNIRWAYSFMQHHVKHILSTKKKFSYLYENINILLRTKVPRWEFIPKLLTFKYSIREYSLTLSKINNYTFHV